MSSRRSARSSRRSRGMAGTRLGSRALTLPETTVRRKYGGMTSRDAETGQAAGRDRERRDPSHADAARGARPATPRAPRMAAGAPGQAVEDASPRWPAPLRDLHASIKPPGGRFTGTTCADRCRVVAALSAAPRFKVPGREKDSCAEYQRPADAVDETETMRPDPLCNPDGKPAPDKQDDTVDQQIGSSK